VGNFAEAKANVIGMDTKIERLRHQKGSTNRPLVIFNY
jgi:hypothetical protein